MLSCPPDRLQQIAQARQGLLGDGRWADAPRVAPWIERSWQRCLSQGLRPEQRVDFDTVSRAAIEQARGANRSLIRAAAPVIAAMARTMADTGYFAILTDAAGVVIDVNGPLDPANRLAQAIARVGVDLSEKTVGTTAIGTALAELQPVWLHRGEHFFDDTSAYSCAGAPLFGPDGRCVGMLDLTGVHVPERPALQHLVTQSAQCIENALLLAQPHALQLRINWPGHGLGGASDGLVCLDADGQITGANRHAAHMLGWSGGAPWPHANHVFALAHEQLFDAAKSERPAQELPLWSGLRVLLLARRPQTAPQALQRNPLPPSPVPLKDLEDTLIRQAVDEARGNVMEAARRLGISRATVYRKLQRRKPPG